MRAKRKAVATDSWDRGGVWSNLVSVWRRYEREPVAADAIYLTVREAILKGVLPAGERLAESHLAALFDRSRTPVREAILRLEAEHLADRSGRRGFVVGGISQAEILEVYAVREVIDGLAARLATHGCLPTDLDHLSWLNRRLRKAGEQRDYTLMVELNLEFHEAIARASRSALLVQFMRQIHDWVRRFTDTNFSYRGRATEALTEHEAIIEALRRRDPAEAEQVTRQHMAHATQVRVAMQQSALHDA
jgi:DNA-binding GntR family transcriptional regulator